IRMSYQQPYGQQQFQQPGYNPQYGQAPYGQQGGYQGQAPPPLPGFVPPPMPRYMPTSNTAEQGGQPGYGGDDGPFKYSLHFNERSIRMAFIRKVFFLVTIMLGVVAFMTALPYLFPEIMDYFRGPVNQSGRRSGAGNLGFFYLAYGTFFVTYLVLVCCEGVRRSFPMNLILTGIFTFATGFMTMCITMQFTIESVLMALIITTACCGIIIIFAMQTKYDLTSCMGVMALLSMFLFVFGIIAIIGTMAFKVRILYTIYAGLGALMFMAYLAIDVQMLMGGRKYEISPEDHIFAAIQLFLDIVQIFWFILSLFGSR
ncbi:hypothetical protein PMAYCL1PPCAC_28472, partial [Pristionchus mayeri]